MSMSSTAGEFITETLEYDGGRQVTAYVSAGAAEAVVLAGDGQLIASWGEVLEAADLPPTDDHRRVPRGGRELQRG
jgi:hypothetical protein